MHLHLIISDEISSLTGGYIYNNHIVEGLRRQGYSIKVHTLMNDFPFPSQESIKLCRNILISIPIGEVIIFDSLVFGVIPDLLKEIKPYHPIVALMHLPLMFGDFNDESKMLLTALEFEAFNYANLIIVTSKFLKSKLQSIGIDSDRIKVVIPGVSIYSHKTHYALKPSHLLYVANYTVNKSHNLLIEALSGLKHLDWTLHCYGNVETDSACFNSLSGLVNENFLQNRIMLCKSVHGKALSSVYSSADIFIHPSSFETYGMVLSEALSHGIPVIVSKEVKRTNTVPSDMGLFFATNDTVSLRHTIEELLTDNVLYHNLCSNVSSYLSHSQSWQKTIAEFAMALSMFKVNLKIYN